MSMRTDCKHYESRTYPSGDVVRKCRKDLAPEAPWKCPADCHGYERRMIDAGWQYGSLGESQKAPEPAPATGDDVARLLDEAEEIVNTARFEIQAEHARKQKKRLFRKKGKRR
jgi:hypothetical protein